MGMKCHALGCLNVNIMAVPDPIAFKKSLPLLKWHNIISYFMIFPKISLLIK